MVVFSPVDAARVDLLPPLASSTTVSFGDSGNRETTQVTQPTTACWSHVSGPVSHQPRA